MSFYGEKNETDEQAIIDAIEQGANPPTDVNLTKVAGDDISLGQKPSAESIPSVLSDEQQTLLEGLRQPIYYQGTVTAAAVNVVGLIDGAANSVIELQHRGTQGQFKFTVLVEGTDDPTATGNEAAGSASTAVGWTSLEVRSASGGEMTSIILGGRYLLFNPPRKIRIRCSSYTFGSAQIDVMAKPIPQEDPSRTVSDKDALASLAMTTFGQMQIAERTFLAGSNFDDASLDTDVWTDTSANGGSQSFGNGVITLSTGTSSTGKSGVKSLNLATVLGAADNAITIRSSIGSITNDKYVYRLGVFTATEGTYIQMGGNARTVTDAVFNATTTMTSATGDFTAADLGKRITSSGNVTIGTTITKIVSSTSVLLSAAALTSASGQTVDIEGFGVTYVNRTGGIDTTSSFGVIGFALPTIAANSTQLWEMMFNPNFLIVRNSGNFVQLQVGLTTLAPMFAEYDLPLNAEVENLGSTTNHTLNIQTLTAERLGQTSTIRANESFSPEDVMTSTASIIHGQLPDNNFSQIGAIRRSDGTTALKVDTAGPEKTVFGSQFAEPIRDSISVNFSTSIPSNLINTTVANGGTVTQSAAQMVLQTSTATNGSAVAFSRPTIVYQPGHEVRIDFTGTFTTGVAGATQYTGMFDANDGFYIGYNGADFVVGQRSAGVDTQVAQSTWNGNMSEEFTRDGVVEAIDFTKGNVFRIRFGWLGNSVINYEVMSPDGNYCLMHQVKFPNSSTSASIQNPNKPIRAEVTKTSGASNITFKVSSWRGGVMGAEVGSITSIGNFSNTPLIAGSTFTGTFENVSRFVGITIFIRADQVSASNGITFQFSEDGSTVRASFFRTFSAADAVNGFKFIAIPVSLPFFRVLYENGGTGQGVFYLQCSYNVAPLQQSIDGIESTISSTSSATMVRNIASAANDSGTYDNIKRGSSGGLRSSINQFEVEAPLKSLATPLITRTSVTTTAAKILSSPMANRRSLGIKAICSGSALIYLGTSSAVTSGNGYPLSDGQSIDVELDATFDGFWAIASTGTQAVSVIEVST